VSAISSVFCDVSDADFGRASSAKKLKPIRKNFFFFFFFFFLFSFFLLIFLVFLGQLCKQN